MPTFPMCLPYGHRALEAQRTNWQVFNVPCVLNLKRLTFKSCANWCLKKSHLLSDFMEPALLLFMFHSVLKPALVVWGWEISLFPTKAVTTVVFAAVGLYSSKAEARGSAILLPCSLPAFQPHCSQLPMRWLLLWPQASGCRAGWGEHLTVSRPLPSGSGHHCWHLAWLCYFLFPCSRWGALLSPCVCLPYFIPNNNKAGLRWPCANISRQVTQFLGLCLLLPQLAPPWMLGLSCHFQLA